MSKSIWQRLKESLQLSDDAHVESRRQILKGAAGMALLAAVPLGASEGYRLLTKPEQAELIHRVASGQVIEGQYFLLDRTVVLKGLKNVVIRNCQFVCSDDFVGDYMMQFDQCEGLVIRDCSFQLRGQLSAGIKMTAAGLQA